MHHSHRLTLAAALSLSGCFSPWNTRFPELSPHSTQYDRNQAKVQDPFPDKNIGPDDPGLRPPDYQQQRAVPLRTRERADAAIMRQMNGVPGGGATPGPNGSLYPDAVRQ